MRSILEFELPEDEEAYRFAYYGSEAFSAIENIREMLRKEWKWGEFGDEAQDLIDKLWQEFHEIVEPLP